MGQNTRMSSLCLCIYLNRFNQRKKEKAKKIIFFLLFAIFFQAFVEASTAKKPTLNIFAVIFCGVEFL